MKRVNASLRMPKKRYGAKIGNRGPSWSSGESDVAKTMWESGSTAQEISKVIERSSTAIAVRASLQGWKRAVPMKSGVKSKKQEKTKAVKSPEELANDAEARAVRSELRAEAIQEMTGVSPETTEHLQHFPVAAEEHVFPKLESVKFETFQPLAQTVLARIAATNGKLRFEQDAYAVGIEEVNDWLEFVQEVFEKSARIARALNVPQKFTVSGSGKERCIVYGDGSGYAERKVTA
jgi:hypothetical protein